MAGRFDSPRMEGARGMTLSLVVYCVCIPTFPSVRTPKSRSCFNLGTKMYISGTGLGQRH